MTAPASWRCPECGDTHRVPRRTGAYRATTHFQQRYRDRDPPAGIIADCIERGTLKRCREEGKRFAETGGWRVVLALVPAVEHGDRDEHAAVSIYRVSNG
jgi:hypothetical protein